MPKPICFMIMPYGKKPTQADAAVGVPGGEAHELVFVSAPLDLWDKGPSAANAWIKEHLQKEFGGSGARALRPLPGPS